VPAIGGAGVGTWLAGNAHASDLKDVGIGSRDEDAMKLKSAPLSERFTTDRLQQAVYASPEAAAESIRKSMGPAMSAAVNARQLYGFNPFQASLAGLKP
jgi:hypothetical protein